MKKFMLCVVLLFVLFNPSYAKLSSENIKLCKQGTAKKVEAALKSKKLDLLDTVEHRRTPLMLAAKFNKNPGVITALVKYGADTEDRDSPYNMTALCLALYENSPDSKIIKELIDNGADASAKSNFGTPLSLAAEYCPDARVISLLVEAGADVNGDDSSLPPPLFCALQEKSKNLNNVAVVEELIRCGADVNALWNSLNILDQAVTNRAPAETVRALIEAGIEDINETRTWEEMAVLHRAAQNGASIEVLGELIKAGADINLSGKKGYTPIMYAITPPKINYHTEMVVFLWDCGADETKQDEHGRTAIEIAQDRKDFRNSKDYPILMKRIETRLTEDDIELCKSGTADEIRAALDDGSIFAWERDEEGNVPLLIAAASNPSAEVTSLLLEKTLNVNRRNKDGATALMLAAEHSQNPEIIELLIKAGADISMDRVRPDGDSSDKDGLTALLHAAAFNPSAEIMSAVLKSGAKIEEGDSFNANALMYAAEKNSNPEILSMLVSAGIDVNAKDNRGETALMHAVKGGAGTAMIARLLELGADIGIKTPRGKTVLDMTKDKDVLALFGKESPMAKKPEPIVKAETAESLVETSEQAVVHEESPDKPEEVASAPKTEEPESKITAAPPAQESTITEEVIVTPFTELLEAAEKGTDVGRLAELVNNGADIKKCDENGCNALFYAVKNPLAKQFVQALIDLGADPSVKNKNNDTLLMYAAAFSSVDVIEMFMDKGKIDHRNNEGHTALAMAAMYNTPQAIEFLIKNGADPEKPDAQGCTALMFAARNNTPEAVKALIDGKARLDSRDDDKMTALMYAAKYTRHPGVIEALLDAKANASLADKDGNTAFDHAEKNEIIAKTEAIWALKDAEKKPGRGRITDAFK